jgi:membrane associated rhomboid family serine protease
VILARAGYIACISSSRVLPIRVENPLYRLPVVTIALIAACIAAWFFVQGAGADPALARSICRFGLIPGELTGAAAGARVPIAPGAVCVVSGDRTWLPVLTSMFLHGGWLHLAGNLWFLWLFGSRVEDSTGRLRFVVLYLVAGLAAAGAQILVEPGSAIPMVGASGAIAGVMGAYLVLYPRTRVDLLVFLGFLITTLRVPAYVMLGYWFVLQVLSGLPALGAEVAGGVAFWAHAGGFVAGALAILVLRRATRVEEHQVGARAVEERWESWYGDRHDLRVR